MDNNQLMNEANALSQNIIKMRRHLHQIPGTGFDLEETVEYVKQQLNMLGIEAKECGKSGLTATIGNGGKVFMLRADMDALPIVEDSGEEFSSTNGKTSENQTFEKIFSFLR